MMITFLQKDMPDQKLMKGSIHVIVPVISICFTDVALYSFHQKEGKNRWIKQNSKIEEKMKILFICMLIFLIFRA